MFPLQVICCELKVLPSPAYRSWATAAENGYFRAYCPVHTSATAGGWQRRHRHHRRESRRAATRSWAYAPAASCESLATFGQARANSRYVRDGHSAPNSAADHATTTSAEMFSAAAALATSPLYRGFMAIMDRSDCPDSELGATTAAPTTGTKRPCLCGFASTRARTSPRLATAFTNVTPFDPAPQTTVSPGSPASR
jgi:hypothetical protein